MFPNSNLLVHSSPRFLALYLALLLLFLLHKKPSSSSRRRSPFFALLLAFVLLFLYSVLGLTCLSNSCPSDHLSSQLSLCSAYLAYLLGIPFLLNTLPQDSSQNLPVDFTSSRTLYSYLSRKRIEMSRRLLESLTHLLHFLSSVILNVSLFLPPAFETSLHLIISVILSVSSLLPCVVYLSIKIKSPSSMKSSPVPTSASLFSKLFMLNQFLALVFAVTSFWPGLFDTLGGFALILRSSTCGLMLSEHHKLLDLDSSSSSTHSTHSSILYAQSNRTRSRSHSDSTIRARPKQGSRAEGPILSPFLYPRNQLTPSTLFTSPSEDFLTLRDPFASPSPPSSPLSPVGHDRSFNSPTRPQIEQKGSSIPPRRKRPRRGTLPLPTSGPAQGMITGNGPSAQACSSRQPKHRHQVERMGIRYSSSPSLAGYPDRKLPDEVDARFLQQLLLYSISNGSLASLPMPT